MTIRRGEPWGDAAVCPTDLKVVASDSDLREWVVWHRSRGQSIGDVGVSGGDLARTCGGGTGAHPSSARVTLDVMQVIIDDAGPTWGVAHVVARRGWLRDEIAMVMNAQFLGAYDVAPRSHPNDGKLDAVRVDASMGWRDRLQARRRARTGTHVPHPLLSAQSLADVDLRFDRPMVVWVDGVRCGAALRLRVSVEPDAFTAYV